MVHRVRAIMPLDDTVNIKMVEKYYRPFSGERQLSLVYRKESCHGQIGAQHIKSW